MLVQAGERKAREVAHSELALCSAAFAVGLGKNKIEGRFLAPWLQQVRIRLRRQLFPAARMQKLLSFPCGWLRSLCFEVAGSRLMLETLRPWRVDRARRKQLLELEGTAAAEWASLQHRCKFRCSLIGFLIS